MVGNRIERGSALPLVLWILSVLLITSFAFASLVQSRLRRTQLLFTRLEAHSEAYSAVQIGLHLLLTGRSRGSELIPPSEIAGSGQVRLFLDGTPAPVPRVSPRVTLAIQNCAGLVDLRQSPEALLDGLLREFGADVERRRVFIDSLRDWTDRDDFVRLNGAEKDDYERLGYRPRNQALVTIDEIALIRGMDPALFERIRPFLTLDTAEGFNLAFAPLEVLKALPNMTEDDARKVIEFRKASPLGGVGAFSALTGIDLGFDPSFFQSGTSRTYNLTATVPLDEERRYVLECQVTLRLGLRIPAFGSGAEGAVGNLDMAEWQAFEVKYWRAGTR